MAQNSVEIILKAKDQFSDATKKAQLEFAAMKIAADNLNNSVAKLEKLHPGLDHQEAVAAATALESMKNGSDKAGKSFDNASIAGRGFAQLLGFELPRSVTTFLAKSDTIGPLLSKAFGTVAVLGMVEALAQVPEMFSKLEGAITGWDEKAKKSYADFLANNDKAIERLSQFKAKMLEVSAPTAEEGERRALAARLRDAQAEQTQTEQQAGTARTRANAVRPPSGMDSVGGLLTGFGLARSYLGGYSELAEEADRLEKKAQEKAAAITAIQDNQKTFEKTVANEPGRKQGEAADAAVKGLDDEKVAMASLVAGIRAMEAQHATAEQIVAHFGSAIDTVTASAEKASRAVSSTIVPYAALIFAQKEYATIAKETDPILEKANAQTIEQASNLITAEASFQNYLAVMATLPLGTAEAKRHFDTVNELIEHSEQGLQRLASPFGGGSTISRFTIPGTGAASAPPAQIGAGSHIMDSEDYKRLDDLGQHAIDSWTRSIGDMFANSITSSKSFWQQFTEFGKAEIVSLTRFMTENLLKGLLAPFKQSIGSAVGGTGSALSGGLFSSLGRSAFGGPGAGSSLLSHIPAASGLFGALFGAGAGVPAATASTLGPLAGIAGAGGALAAPAIAAPSIGLGPAMAGFFTNPVTLGIMAGILGGIGLYELFKHRTTNAPFTSDPNAVQQNREYLFYTGATALADAAKDFRAVTQNFNTMAPGPLVKSGLTVALNSSNRFRRDVFGILSDDA